MSTFTQILYQVVFSTRNRERSLLVQNRPVLFKYIWGILKEKNCHLYRINGVEDHIHIAFSLHPSVSLSSLVKDIKLASSKMIKEQELFPFTAWQEGYAAFTYSLDAKNDLIEYIKNQEEHHKKVDFKEELISLLEEFQIEYDEKYLK
ncbi:IS200/IS605 family transposase [uncultured Arcticibacterium sp.]|uniref:IS200/IS605 family transposase n=1 Tax=uncultured Arcticibacterium sp. TaxID=2173042 RepID=UPI0030F77B43